MSDSLKSIGPCYAKWSYKGNPSQLAYDKIIHFIVNNTNSVEDLNNYIDHLKKITMNCNSYIDTIKIEKLINKYLKISSEIQNRQKYIEIL